MQYSTRARWCVASICCAVAVVVFSGTEGRAAFSMKLSDGSSTIQVNDGAAGDLNGNAGRISWIGSIGDFSFNIVSGLSTPAIGSLSDPSMALSGLVTSFGGDGELTIMLTQTGFTNTPTGLDAAAFLTSLDVDLGDAMEFQTWVGLSNGAFEQSVLLSDLSGISGSDTSDVVQLASNFSLTMVAKVTHERRGWPITMFSSGLEALDQVNALPEPSMVAMWAGMGGCAALGAAMRRRWRKA